MWTDENRVRYRRDHLRYPSDLTDPEWTLIAPMMPPPKRADNTIGRGLKDLDGEPLPAGRGATGGQRPS